MTLKELGEHFARLYGRRSRLCIDGINERIDFLGLAVGDLQNAIRRGPDDSRGQTLASVIAWLFCIIEHFHNLDFLTALARKYPYEGCGYCGESRCQCDSNRQDNTLETNTSPQLNWTLDNWCQHLNNVYGLKNRKAGLDNTMSRLFREVCELKELTIRVSMPQISLDQLEEAIAFEIADIFAWTVAVANIASIPLEGAVMYRFGAHCPTCLQNPCQCPPFILERGQLRRVGANSIGA